MRTALPDDVAYFEADLTGFTSIRGMRQAATQEKKLDIPFQSPSPVPVQDPIQAAGRPCWADEDCLGGEWFKHNRAEVSSARVITNKQLVIASC
jgi:malonyl CoA-acyl carrier protein transacylase